MFLLGSPKMHIKIDLMQQRDQAPKRGGRDQKKKSRRLIM